MKLEARAARPCDPSVGTKTEIIVAKKKGSKKRVAGGRQATNLSRVCTVCGSRKSFSEFHNDSQKSSGKRPDCKECVKRRLRARSQTEQYREYARSYRRKNREAINKNKVKSYWADPEKHRQQKLDDHKKHREQRIQSMRKRYQENREQYLEKAREYQKANWRQTLEYKDRHKRRMRQTSPIFVLAERCSKRVRASIVALGYRKNSRTEKILGCSWEHFKRHIESLFPPGMNWKNVGRWQLDHHIPISIAPTVHWLEVLNHWSNWKPMWTRDNLSKNKKLPQHVLLPPLGMKQSLVKQSRRLASRNSTASKNRNKRTVK